VSVLALGLGSIAISLLGGGVVAVAVFTWWRSRLGPSPPGAECLRASCADVTPGGAIRLAGFGDDGEDVELTVSRRRRVRLGDHEWLELSGEYRGRTLAVEWPLASKSDARPQHVVAYRRTGISLDGVGLAAPALETAKPGSPPVTFLDSTFRVEETGDAIRHEPGPVDSIAVRTWGFLDEEKRRFVRIDRVGEQPPLASEGVLVASDAIEILRLKG
jgi:hypothetical protein